MVKIQNVKEISCYNPLVVEEPPVLGKSRCDTVWQSAWVAWYSERLMYFKVNDTLK